MLIFNVFKFPFLYLELIQNYFQNYTSTKEYSSVRFEIRNLRGGFFGGGVTLGGGEGLIVELFSGSFLGW